MLIMVSATALAVCWERIEQVEPALAPTDSLLHRCLACQHGIDFPISPRLRSLTIRGVHPIDTGLRPALRLLFLPLR